MTRKHGGIVTTTNNIYKHSTQAAGIGLASYTYTNQPGGATGTDCPILLSTPTTNYGTRVTLDVGVVPPVANIARFLWKDSFSSIPINAEVTSATLYLYKAATDSTTANYGIWAYRLLKNWVESQATWNIYSTGNNWSSAGLEAGTDYDDSVILGSTTLLTGAALGTEYIMTLNPAIIQQMISGTYPNYGICIGGWASGGGANVYYYLGSSDNATAAYRPKIVVNYYA
jgi:hypothetical protein